MTGTRTAATFTVYLCLALPRFASASDDGPDPESIRARLDGPGFQQAIARCTEGAIAELTLVVKVEQDGSSYLVDTAPETLPKMTVNCLASEVLKLEVLSSDASYRFSYAVAYMDDGSMQSKVLIEKVHPVEPWEPKFADGRKLLARGLILTVVGDVFLTVAVALFPSLHVQANSAHECSATQPCGPSDDVWLAFDIVGMAAGFVVAVVGAAMMQMGWVKRKAAFDTAASGLSIAF